MATIRRKGNGWEAAINRRGVRKSKTFTTKTRAAHWAAEVEREIIAGKQKVIENKTFGDLLLRYVDEVSSKKRGYPWELRRITALCRDEIARVLLTDLCQSDFAGWRDKRLYVVSVGTVLREMNLLNHALNISVKEWRWLTENPLSGVKRPQQPQARDRLISDSEITRLLFALGYDHNIELKTISSRVGAALLFAIETAMRVSEITRLIWEHIDLEKRTALLTETKNGSKRDVPLSSEAIRILNQLKSDSDSVFNLEPSQIDSLFRKAKKMTLVEDLHFHDSRHLAITRLARKLDVLALARMVGHRDLRMLQIYYNESAEDMAKRLD